MLVHRCGRDGRPGTGRLHSSSFCRGTCCVSVLRMVAREGTVAAMRDTPEQPRRTETLAWRVCNQWGRPTWRRADGRRCTEEVVPDRRYSWHGTGGFLDATRGSLDDGLLGHYATWHGPRWGPRARVCTCYCMAASCSSVRQAAVVSRDGRGPGWWWCRRVEHVSNVPKAPVDVVVARSAGSGSFLTGAARVLAA
jgi:hypothetical protein